MKNEAAIKTAFIDLMRAIDPDKQGTHWPDPITADGRPIQEQIGDLLAHIGSIMSQMTSSQTSEMQYLLDEVEAFYAAVGQEGEDIELPTFEFPGYRVTDGWGSTLYYPFASTREEAALEYCSVFREQADDDAPLQETVKTWNTIPMYESDEQVTVIV